jgi:hypothetical protein
VKLVSPNPDIETVSFSRATIPSTPSELVVAPEKGERPSVRPAPTGAPQSFYASLSDAELLREAKRLETLLTERGVVERG